MGKRREAPRVTAQHRRRQDRLRALVSREKTQKAFALKHGLNPKHLSQMLSTPGGGGWRGVGDDIVEKLEADKKLNLQPGHFDAVEVSELPAAVVAEPRPKNNVKALRIAMQSLFSILHAKMQDTAEAVASDILETAGTEFVEESILDTLVGILRGEQQNEELAEKAPQPSQSSQASKRVTSAAKRPS
jgi:hypothetical protein